MKYLLVANLTQVSCNYLVYSWCNDLQKTTKLTEHEMLLPQNFRLFSSGESSLNRSIKSMRRNMKAAVKIMKPEIIDGRIAKVE